MTASIILASISVAKSHDGWKRNSIFSFDLCKKRKKLFYEEEIGVLNEGINLLTNSWNRLNFYAF